MKYQNWKWCLLNLLLSCSVCSMAQQAVTPIGLRIDATYENLSILVDIDGDTNNNSMLTIEYRQVGESNYLPTYRTMRAIPQSIVDGDPLGRNYHAGSFVGLMPNTEYEVKLTLTDPDGGGQSAEYIAKTKQESPERQVGSTVHVIPYNYDVFNIGDDLYEVDDMVANTRVYANRGTNGRNIAN